MTTLPSTQDTGLGTPQGPPYAQQQATATGSTGTASGRDRQMFGLRTPDQVPLDYNAEAGG